MTTSRRDFLKIFSSLPLAAAVTRPAEASTPSAQPPARLLLNRSTISGFQYCDVPALVHCLRPGQELVYSLEFGQPTPQPPAGTRRKAGMPGDRCRSGGRGGE